MEFGLSEEQRLLEASVRGVLADRLPMVRRRAIAEAGRGLDDELWQALVAQGIAGLLVPERHGGSGLGVLEAALVAESLGYHAAPVPFAGPLAMAPLALMASGNEAQQQAWLPRIATGEVRIAVAFAGDGSEPGAGGIALDGDRLSGRLPAVLDGAGATHALVYLADGRAALVDLAAPGAARSAPASLDRTRPPADLAFDQAPSVVLGAANDPKAAAARVRDAGRVLLAADTLGAAQAMHDQALAWAKERRQFGRVIGSFQGVKHTLADMVTMLEPCRGLVWYAAHAQDALPDEARLTALQAKAHVGDVGREIARLATEVHGGMGFTDLVGLHYWFKRIGASRYLLGAPETCRHEAAVAQGWVASQG